MVNSNTAVFLFAGNDSFSKEQAIKKLEKSLIDPSARELNYKVFDGAQTQACDILDFLSTVPFLSARRIAVVKNSRKFSSEDNVRIADFIKEHSKSACLILDAEDDSFLKEQPELARLVNVSRFGSMSESQFQSRAKEVLLSIGDKKNLSPDAAKILKELCGDDMGSVSQELHKLSSFVGEKSTIEAGDVEAIVGKNINASAFELTDAIEARDLKKALSIISDLVASGKKHYEIVGLLCWQMKRLFRGKLLLEKKMTADQIADSMKISRRYQDGFFKQIKSTTLDAIGAKLKVLLEADLDIKRTKYDPGLALEFAVIKLCLGLR
jgi:DNA polymerase-3 subunit delta